jgi:hypothetical protein
LINEHGRDKSGPYVRIVLTDTIRSGWEAFTDISLGDKVVGQDGSGNVALVNCDRRLKD